MRSAIIKDGIVTNVIVGSTPGSIECSKEIGIGWAYDGGKFTAPPQPEPEPLTLDEARTAAYERAKAKHAEALKSVKDRYPQTEIDGWPELVGDAKEGSGVCIEAYAASMGISVSDACQRILTVREGYRAAYGEATGALTKMRDQIDSAETAEELDAISWPT